MVLKNIIAEQGSEEMTKNLFMEKKKNFRHSGQPFQHLHGQLCLQSKLLMAIKYWDSGSCLKLVPLGWAEHFPRSVPQCLAGAFVVRLRCGSDEWFASSYTGQGTSLRKPPSVPQHSQQPPTICGLVGGRITSEITSGSRPSITV